MTRDTETGPERYCRRCASWWPDDAEFFYEDPRGYRQCRACQAEDARNYRRRTIEGPWGPVVVSETLPRVPCATTGCLVQVPVGRQLCHGCGRRDGRCGRVMPRVPGERCARGAGHRNRCRTRYAMDNELTRRWYGVRAAA